jgi:hypothetical protein
MIIVSNLSFFKGMLVLLFVIFFYLPHTKTMLTGMKYLSTEAFWNFKNYIAELKNKIEITQKPCPKHAKN